MDVLTIQLKHAKARQLLQELEDMNIIKMLDSKKLNHNKKPSQLRGALSKKTAGALHKHITKTREEWSGRFPSK
jgi:hypothetical protein